MPFSHFNFCILSFLQAKAFDKETSALHYLVSIAQKNDEDVLKISQDFIPLKSAERVSIEALDEQMKKMNESMELVKGMLKKYPQIRGEGDVTSAAEVTKGTTMDQFFSRAVPKILSMSEELTHVKSNFKELLQYFGECEKTTPKDFFCIINKFAGALEQARKDLRTKETQVCACSVLCMIWLVLLFKLRYSNNIMPHAYDFVLPEKNKDEANQIFIRQHKGMMYHGRNG